MPECGVGFRIPTIEELGLGESTVADSSLAGEEVTDVPAPPAVSPSGIGKQSAVPAYAPERAADRVLVSQRTSSSWAGQLAGPGGRMSGVRLAISHSRHRRTGSGTGSWQSLKWPPSRNSRRGRNYAGESDVPWPSPNRSNRWNPWIPPGLGRWPRVRSKSRHASGGVGQFPLCLPGLVVRRREYIRWPRSSSSFGPPGAKAAGLRFIWKAAACFCPTAI